MSTCQRWAAYLLIATFVVSGRLQSVRAADEAAIEQAIGRGKAYLLSQNKSMAVGSLACYSLIKAGVDKQHPDVQKVVAEILGKCRTDGYIPTGQHNYEAGVDAMLLEAVDRELYRPQLEKIAQFLIQRQRPHGGWYYPTEFGANTDFGDTSISQYAILGLWAAERAEIEVPVETWERAAKWLLLTQRREGGFGYHPTDPAKNGGNSGNDVLGTMTVAGTGSLLVIRHVLFHDNFVPEPTDDRTSTSSTSTRRFGVLDRPPDDKEKEKEKKSKPKGKTTMSASTFERPIKDGTRWIGDRYGDASSQGAYANYYFYGVERVAAVLGVEKIGKHDWYNEGADFLLARQANDGSWNDSCGPVAATSLTILFLSKATAGTINRPAPRKRPALVGGGLLVGGRGLPDNLDAVKVKEGEVSRRKVHGPIDGLLAELEKSSGAKVEEAQDAVVEAVQLDDPTALIGQVDRLKRLSSDKRVEVRRTAMWALGRTGNVSVAPYLIRGLADPDESVMREASLGLCILSRRPSGCGLPTDPAEGLADNAAAEVRLAHLDKWQKDCSKAWTDWYMKIRPYDERDDRTGLKRKP
jgi:hypothetical protein